MERRIAKLDPSVVHRIAAGEVIQRPANAIKEMIENSVDAGATMIQLVIQEGGLKQIQIQDNGHGILKEDLALLCERFATSKLTKFEDLSCMKTFGFRGEALASISHVARVSVISKTKDSPCAFKAEYLNGVQLSDPQAVAGNQGTIITVSDLFYNIPTRLKGLNNSSEEYSHILKVLQRYAIQLAGRVGISCRKAGIGSNSDIQTSATLATTPKDVMRSIYGSQVYKGLVELGPCKEESLEVEISGCISIPTYHQKSLQFILFINGRLVDSAHIKRAVVSLYGQILLKGTSPFVYLSLTMPPQNIDVNVHPTKSEVFFLHEVQVLEFIDKSIRETLQKSSLVFDPMPILTQQTLQETKIPEQQAITPLNSQTKKLYPFQMVHSDPKTRTLDIFVSRVTKKPRTDSVPVELEVQERASSESIETSEIAPISSFEKSNTQSITVAMPRFEKKPVSNVSVTEDPRELTSVRTLIAEIEESRHDRLTDMIKNSVIVGLFDSTHTLIQYQSQLLMIDHLRFAVEMLYQKCLLGFGFHDCWKLPQGLAIARMLRHHVSNFYPDHSQAEIELMIDVFSQHEELLLDYFSVHIVDGVLIALPRLLEGLEAPEEDILSEFLYRIAVDVGWEDEQKCFKSMALLFAQTFSSLVCAQPRQEEYIRHFLYPALKGADMTKFGHIIGYDRELVKNGSIIEITSTHELYKIFERC